MKHGDRLAQELQFGRSRSFADLMQQEPCLRQLNNRVLAATLAAHKRRKAWRRVAKVMAWVVIALWAMLLVLSAVTLLQ